MRVSIILGVLLFGAIGCKGLAKTTARRTVVHAVAAQTQERPAPKQAPATEQQWPLDIRARDLRSAQYLRDCVKSGRAVPDCVKVAGELHALPESGHRIH